MSSKTQPIWVAPSQHINPMDRKETEMVGMYFGFILQILSWVIIILTFPLSMCFCLKVIKEYERIVIFRLGRLMQGGARGPGMIFILPCIDTYRKIDLRWVALLTD